MGQRKGNGDNLVENDISSPLKVTRGSRLRQQMEIINSVFCNQLVMDKILKYSVYKSNGKPMDKQTIMATRLVNKSWLQSTSRVLKTSGDSVVLLELGCQNGLSYVNSKIYKNEKEDILDKLVSVFSKTSRSSNSILPINFGMDTFYLKKANFKKLANFFEECGDVVSELSMNYPLDVSLVNFDTVQLNFPILKSFIVDARSYKNYKLTSTATKNISNGLKIVQDVLQNSQKLKTIMFSSDDEAPVNLDSISLPETLNCVKLIRPFTDNELSLLTKNQLPNLTSLSLVVGKQDDVSRIYKVSQHFRHQITKMTIYCQKDIQQGQEEPLIIELPSLEKLKCLKLIGFLVDFSPEFRQLWSKFLPNLSNIIFDDLQVEDQSMLIKWFQGSSFPNVKKLKCLLSYGKHYDQNSIQIIRQAITSFPNIQKLTLKFLPDETSGPKYLFRSFTHLKKLRLNFDFKETDDSTGCKMVSLFLGISLELATALVHNTGTAVSISFDNPESIMNLKELCSLTLWSPIYDCSDERTNPLCAQVISRHGLEKMPKLRKIKFLGGFEIDQSFFRSIDE